MNEMDLENLAQVAKNICKCTIISWVDLSDDERNEYRDDDDGNYFKNDQYFRYNNECYCIGYFVHMNTYAPAWRCGWELFGSLARKNAPSIYLKQDHDHVVVGTKIEK